MTADAVAESPLVWLVGAPSGGHIYPGIALARALEAWGVTARFLSSGGPVEEKIFASAGVDAPRIAGARPRSPGSWRPAWRDLTRCFSEARPSAVIGLGGGPTVLPALLARRRRCPVFLLEQNRVVGRANRWLLPFARRLFLSFADTVGPRRLRSRALHLGCPVRSSFEPGPVPVAEEELRLLVLGGSQGAESVNQLLPDAVAGLGDLKHRLSIHHLTGPGKEQDIGARYEAAAVRARVEAYSEDPGEALRASSLVISRAGGTTLAELAAVGRGAFLLPYPHHRDRQQFRNADAFVVAGAARVIEPRSEVLAEALAEVLRDPERARRMGDAARGLGVPRAADRIAEVIATHLDRVPARWGLGPVERRQP